MVSGEQAAAAQSLKPSLFADNGTFRALMTICFRNQQTADLIHGMYRRRPSQSPLGDSILVSSPLRGFVPAQTATSSPPAEGD